MVINGNNIKAQRTFRHVAFGEEALRGANHDALFLAGYAEFRQRGGVFFHRARAHFHKRQSLPIVADKVQFAFDAARHVVFRYEHITVTA